MSNDNRVESIELHKANGPDAIAAADERNGLRNVQAGTTFEYQIERTDDFDLRYYLERVWRRRTLVLLVTWLLTTVAAFFIFSRESVYEAKARIQVDYENNGPIAGAASEPTTFVDRAYFNTQLELLTSPTLIKRAVKRLEDKGSQEIASADRMSPLSLLPSASGIIFAKAEATAAPGEGQEPVIADIVESLSIQPVLKARQAIKDTRLIEISYTHKDPAVASVVPNALADELVYMNLDKKLATNATENKFLRENINDLREKVRRDEEQLLGYGRNFQLPTLEGSQNTVVERLVGLNRQLLESENERKNAEATYQAALEPNAANAMAEEGAKNIADIDNKLDELRQRRGLLLVDVTEKYPEVREIDGQIAVLERQATDRRSRATNIYKTNAETRYRQALAKENAIRTSFDQQRGATLDQNAAAINYRIIQQSIETNRKLLDGMTQRSTENEMLRAKVPNNISVVDYAATPTDPVDKKNLQFLAIALMLSLSAGVGLALLRDYFDTAVNSADEVEKAISSPTLAVIPGARYGFLESTRNFISHDQLRLLDAGDEPIGVSGGAELILNSAAQSPINESFRRLRTALLLSPGLGELKKILVTSSRKGEGKTTTSINIATSLSRSGVKVLLIDADLRNPRLHKVFSIRSSPGLADLLTATETPDDLSEHVSTIGRNLDILSAGAITETSAELLASGRLEEILEKLTDQYDHIIIDSPPVTAFADSTVIASMVDGVLMVVQGNKNSQEAVRHSARLLRMVGAHIVGVVLNKVNVKDNDYYGTYYK